MSNESVACAVTVNDTNNAEDNTSLRRKYLNKDTFVKSIESVLLKRNIKLVEDPTKIDTLCTLSQLRDHFADIKKNVSNATSNPKKNKKKGYKKPVEFSDEDLNDAMLDLVMPELLPMLSKYPRTQPYWSDPMYQNQVFCVHSFVPSPDAKPDKDGIYGMFKCRGTFATEKEMDDRCQHIIKDIDSCHTLLQGFVGKPYPCTTKEKYCNEIKEIDIKDEMKQIIARDMKQQKEREQNEQKEIEESRQELMKRAEEEKKGTPDILEAYTTLRVKRANLIYSIVDLDNTRKKQIQYLKDCLNEVEIMDKEYPDCQNKFEEQYSKAMESAGIPTSANHIMKYFVGSPPFPLE